ncbi:MAG: DUF2797 domain-containing protein [Salinirussus sp.]
MQIVGYRTAAAEEGPALVFAVEGRVRTRSLAPGTELEYGLGERRCAGTVDGTGHDPCEAPTAPYCPAHVGRWACARCTGDCDLPLDTCREEHAVYLAAFAPATFKVGVTRSWRLETRLREQGADRAAHLRTVENGRTARQIEAEIADDVGDSVRVRSKIEGLHRSVDETAWSGLLDRYEHVETDAFEYGFDLSSRPVPETVAHGTVRGTKGRVLVLDAAGSTYAVDMRELVGYEVDRDGDPSDRRLQSSLGAFR